LISISQPLASRCINSLILELSSSSIKINSIEPQAIQLEISFIKSQKSISKVDVSDISESS
jgi:hypothetical protein